MPKSLKRLSSEERDIEVRKEEDKLASLAGNDAETIAKRVAIKKKLQKIARQRKAFIQAESLEPHYILERQTSAARRSAERRSAERRSAERRSERQRKIDNGELIEGTVSYQREVVPGIISLNKSKAEIENMISPTRPPNLKRYNETSEMTGMWTKARGKKHKKTKKSNKKRKTHKKRKSAHKKSRKH
jgi:hypothetical protein